MPHPEEKKPGPDVIISRKNSTHGLLPSSPAPSPDDPEIETGIAPVASPAARGAGPVKRLKMKLACLIVVQ